MKNLCCNMNQHVNNMIYIKVRLLKLARKYCPNDKQDEIEKIYITKF